MSYILEYLKEIESGRVLVPELVRIQYDRLAEEAECPGRWHLDQDLAQRHIDFIEVFCKQSQGEIGKPLKLELFQKAMLEATFGFVDDEGMRQFREVNFFVGRKNGKSELLSGVALDLLCNDKEGAPEIYTIATKLDQAKRCFDEAERMRKHSPALAKHLRKRASDIYFPANEGIIKPLASDVKKLDSYNASGIIIDELGAITNRRIYDDMKQATSSRRQPLLFCISTNNFVRGGIFDAQVEYGEKMLRGEIKDDRFLFLYYRLEKKEQWEQPRYWILANPGLGTIKKRETLEEFVEKAKVDPSFRPTVLVKDFNLTETNTDRWLPYDDAVNEDAVPIEELEGCYAIGGCDLSSTTDLTCATVIIKKPGIDKYFVLQQYFLPEKRVAEVERQDVKEAPYREWEQQGWLTVCPGASVNYHEVTEWFVALVREHNMRPLWVGYDRALAGYWHEEMEDYGFDMEKIAQGAYTWTYPMKQLAADFHEHKIVYQNNPVLLWCLINTAVKSRNRDGIESIMPVKAQNNRRIDGMVSLLNAYTCLKNHEEEYMQYVQYGSRK